MVWLPLGVLLVPFAMIWGGAARRTAVLVGLGLAALALLLWAILRMTGMSLHHLDRSDGPPPP